MTGRAGADAREVADLWDLAPHPEGGFYRETYRSGMTAEPEGWPGARPGHRDHLPAALRRAVGPPSGSRPGFHFDDFELG